MTCSHSPAIPSELLFYLSRFLASCGVFSPSGGTETELAGLAGDWALPIECCGWYTSRSGINGMLSGRARRSVGCLAAGPDYPASYIGGRRVTPSGTATSLRGTRRELSVSCLEPLWSKRWCSMRVTDDSGKVLNAEFLVEEDAGRLALVLNSAGGPTSSGILRNADYRAALTLLLDRLREREAVLLDALVDSLHTRRLGIPERDRRLIASPVQLAELDTIEGLRAELTRAQGRIGQAAAAPKAGNNSKRIRLILDVPGYSPADAGRLEADLGGTPPFLVDEVEEWLASPGPGVASDLAELASINSRSTPRAWAEAPSAHLIRATPPGAELVNPATRYKLDQAGSINAWWSADPRQRFWLEITDRRDIGVDLHCPQRGQMENAAQRSR